MIYKGFLLPPLGEFILQALCSLDMSVNTSSSYDQKSAVYVYFYKWMHELAFTFPRIEMCQNTPNLNAAHHFLWYAPQVELNVVI